jgi:hypothetical protein
MRSGLRNDYNAKGEQQGRTGVMADPRGHGDKCKNRYLQREKGIVRIVVSMDKW